MTKNGFTKVYLGVLYGQDIGGVSGLEEELELQVKGLASIEQIDAEKCNGCDICVSACPEITMSLDTIVSSRNEYSACRVACPAGVDMRSYMHLFRSGKLDEAAAVLREYLPLPAVTGRVCPHFCETECARNDVDEAVNINSVERFIADYSLKQKAKPVKKKYAKKAAVIGSGPAGLSAAYFLVRMGYPVTVFEQQKTLGGMLRMGIPEYRLPRKVLDTQIDYIKDLGVEFKTDVTIGKDKTIDQLKKEYGAVFFATGNQLSRKLDIEGVKSDGVLRGLDFLKEANLKKNVRVGNRVVVIGGGNVAVDVALTALRLGAKEVEMACLEKGKEIPAYKEEIEQAKAEGVKINEGWGPQKITSAGKKVTGIELVKCTSVFDKSGKFNPAYDNKTKKSLKADMVILAIGQSADFSLAPKTMKIAANNTVKVDEVTLETSMAGVFAGGDNINPAGSVVQAIANGKRAAESIDRYLQGKDLKKGRTAAPNKVQKPPKEGMPQLTRCQTPVNKVMKVAGNFNEVKPGFDRRTAKQEAYRCMTCGSMAVINAIDACRTCRYCEMACPQKALLLAPVKKIKPHVLIAKTWDEVAKWIGCGPEVLKATVEQYNADCDKGYDSLFVKDRVHLMPLRTPPFYVMRSNSDYLDTIGGIKINEKMEVLNDKGKNFPGLYAAGVITGGWQADCYCDVTAGAASGYAVNSGRIAGESATEYIKKK